MRLLCIGDSLTYGFGLSPMRRWTRLVTESGVPTESFGVNGDTTGGMLVRLNAVLQRRDICDCIVLVMGGANDIFYSGSSQAARANMAAMVCQIQAVGALPLVGIIPPFSPALCPENWGSVVDFAAAETEAEDYRRWLRKYCAAFGVDFVDFSGLDPALLSDGLHPNAEANRQMAEIIIAKLSEIEAKLHG